MVSTGPALRTTSGVTISGQAPCSALVASVKRAIAGEVDVAIVIVVIDPGGETSAELADEGAGGLVERRAHAVGGEGDVDDGDAAAQLARVGQIARRGEHDLGERSRARHGGLI